MSDESSAPRARRDADTWARFVAIAVFLVALGLLYTGNVWPPTANDADAVTETVTEVVTPATDTSWIGRAFDNNWAPLTIGTDGTVYVGTFEGLVAMWDTN